MFSDPFLASYDKSGISAIADSEMLGRMQNADLFVINEEFPFSLRGEAMEDKQFTFRADPKYVEIFQELGVDIVTVANNHALDFGRDLKICKYRLHRRRISSIGSLCSRSTDHKRPDLRHLRRHESVTLCHLVCL